jgi:two-component system sensor histidine kinase UhpB
VEPEWAETLADAQELARESLDELRRISYELRPAALDDLGLASALASLCGAVGRRTGIEVAHHIARPLPELPRDAELAVYRIAQEALTNAVRHSGCSRIVVGVTAEPDTLVLRVADDGCGIADDPRSGGGIRGMRERALTVGGRLSLGRAAGGGTEVHLRVPVASAGAEAP